MPDNLKERVRSVYGGGDSQNTQLMLRLLNMNNQVQDRAEKQRVARENLALRQQKQRDAERKLQLDAWKAGQGALADHLLAQERLLKINKARLDDHRRSTAMDEAADAAEMLLLLRKRINDPKFEDLLAALVAKYPNAAALPASQGGLWEQFEQIKKDATPIQLKYAEFAELGDPDKYVTRDPQTGVVVGFDFIGANKDLAAMRRNVAVSALGPGTSVSVPLPGGGTATENLGKSAEDASKAIAMAGMTPEQQKKVSANALAYRQRIERIARMSLSEGEPPPTAEETQAAMTLSDALNRNDEAGAIAILANLERTAQAQMATEISTKKKDAFNEEKQAKSVLMNRISMLRGRAADLRRNAKEDDAKTVDAEADAASATMEKLFSDVIPDKSEVQKNPETTPPTSGNPTSRLQDVFLPKPRASQPKKTEPTVADVETVDQTPVPTSSHKTDVILNEEKFFKPLNDYAIKLKQPARRKYSVPLVDDLGDALSPDGANKTPEVSAQNAYAALSEAGIPWQQHKPILDAIAQDGGVPDRQVFKDEESLNEFLASRKKQPSASDTYK